MVQAARLTTTTNGLSRITAASDPLGRVLELGTRAVRTGLAVVEAVGKLPAREDLRVRLGIATGLAVVIIGWLSLWPRTRSAR